MSDLPDAPRLLSLETGVTLLILAATLIAGAGFVVWTWDAFGPLARKDPRTFLVIALTFTLGSPAIRYRRHALASGLSGWPRVGFTALATATLLCVYWLALALAGAAWLNGTPIATILNRLADLSHPWSSVTAAVSLGLGVWFWITGFVVASAGRVWAPH